MANTLREASAPLTTILADKTGVVAAEVVSSAPSAGQTGLVVYPVPSAAVTATADGADGSVGAAAPAIAIQVGARDASLNLQALKVDTAGGLKASNIGVGLNATGQVSLATTATQIVAANTSRAALLITNISSSVTVYLGSSGVTTSNGYPLLSSNSVSIPATSAIYGIVASGTQTVGYLEIQ